MNKHPTIPPNPTQEAARAFAARLTIILAALAIVVAASFRILGRHTVPLWTRLHRAGARIARLMAGLPTRKPRLRPTHHRPGGPPAAPLPTAQAWLVRVLGHKAAVHAAQLEALLNAPETAALLAAAPSAARTLRPLCRLLGITPPEPPIPKPAPPGQAHHAHEPASPTILGLPCSPLPFHRTRAA